LDANEGLNFQTLKIIEEVGECRRGMALVVNKWDIFEKDEHSAAIYERQLHEAMPTYDYLPVMFVSALTGKRVAKTLETVNGVYTNFARRVSTSELNDFLEETVARQHPAAVRGKWIKLFYITQVDVAPPVFVLFCNYPKLIQESYRRYLLNRMREAFDFTGVPLTLKIKSREKQKSRKKA
jgi:GTP-binding protein